MSDIKSIISKLDECITSNSPPDTVGSKIVENVVKDVDFDILIKKYPELSEIAERASDMEYESKHFAEQGREEIKRVLDILKSKITI